MRNTFGIILAMFASLAMSFTPSFVTNAPHHTTTQLEVTRRDLLTGVVGACLASATMVPAAHAASSTTFFKPEDLFEPAQMSQGDKVDLNSAFVGDYKSFPGMFPHAAGKIASNGPYSAVSDIYKIQGLTSNDKAVFKKYERYFTTNPAGRAFKERINGRVST